MWFERRPARDRRASYVATRGARLDAATVDGDATAKETELDHEAEANVDSARQVQVAVASVSGDEVKAMPPAKKPRRAGPERRIAPDGWGAVASMAVASDGAAFAGRSHGAAVCAWDPDGRIAWTTNLPVDSEWVSTSIQRIDDGLLAYAGGTAAWLLDGATGATTRTLELPKFAQDIHVAPGGTRAIARVSTTHVVLDWPSLASRAAPTQDVSGHVAVSPDGRHYAMTNGIVAHVLELETARHLCAIPHPTYVGRVLWTPDGELVTASPDAHIRFYSLEGESRGELHAAPDSKRKTLHLSALAHDGRRLAAAREDGSVSVFDADRRLLATFPKHQQKLGTRAHTIERLAFSADGAKLWVSAAPRNEPPGLTIHALPV